LIFQWTIFLNFLNSNLRTNNGPFDIFKDKGYFQKPIKKWFTHFFEKDIKLFYYDEHFVGDDEWRDYLPWVDNVPTFINLLHSFLDSEEYLSFCNKNDLYDFNIEHNDCIPSIKVALNDKSKMIVLKKTFLDNYLSIIWKDLIYSDGFINFKWNDLSTGERAVLSCISRLYNLVQRFSSKGRYDSKPKKYEHLIIFLDEPDLGLHAMWQKEFLNDFIQGVTAIRSGCNIQLLITSHSPFLVSDLPKENIIFLDKKKETGNCKVCQPENMSSTFGANIHSLYRNSFFLENGLMGEFAKGKIDGVIEDLNKSDQNLSEERQGEMKFIIEQVGEPLIKDKLLQKYKARFEPIEDRINELKMEIEKLEASRKN